MFSSSRPVVAAAFYDREDALAQTVPQAEEASIVNLLAWLEGR